ncbi:MAG: hypothetical protein Q9172_007660 [Xanthocarpia lactea]
MNVLNSSSNVLFSLDAFDNCHALLDLYLILFYCTLIVDQALQGKGTGTDRNRTGEHPTLQQQVTSASRDALSRAKALDQEVYTMPHLESTGLRAMPGLRGDMMLIKPQCIPWERNWPSEKCNHCINRGHPCSANLTAKEARVDMDQSLFVSRFDNRRPNDEGHSNVRAMWVEDLSPLMSAVIHGHARVVEILLRAGADPNESSRDQGTCLEIASRKGYHLIVESLLLFGVDANAVGIHYRNALHAASAWNQAEIVEVLLRHVASVNGDQMNFDDFSQATAAQESFQLDKQTCTADIPQNALTSYLLPPQQQDQDENFAASAFPQPISHSRNQSGLPTTGVDPLKRNRIFTSSDKEVLGATLPETLRTAPSRLPFSLAEAMAQDVDIIHNHLEHLDSSSPEAPKGRTASPANTADASSSSPPLASVDGEPSPLNEPLEDVCSYRDHPSG